MRITITEQDTQKMILGSSIYSTGGGIEYTVQKKLFKKLFATKKTLELISIDELEDEDFVCTAYAVGSAGNTNFNLSDLLRVALRTLEEYTRKRFKALFAGETNIDIVVFQAASNVGLPVLDADSNGGRAVPEIQFDNFVIAKRPITPLVVVTPNKQIVILKESPDVFAIDKFVRSICATFEKGLIAILDHPIKVRDARGILTHGIFSRSLELGEYIYTHRRNSDILNGIVKKTQGVLLIKGTITKVDIKHNSKKGVLEGYYYITDKKGNVLKIFVKNENIICWLNNRLLLTPPDCILTVDTETLLGIHNSKIRKGEKAMVVGKKATKLWRSSAGINLFSPKHFGFNIKSKLL